MSSSYKPALLKAPIRIVRGGAESPIWLLQTGNKFINLYWVQIVVFRLRQAATNITEPEVVRRIRSTSVLTGVSRLSQQQADSCFQLDREMASILKINVLDSFHFGAINAMKPIFVWRSSDHFITSDEETNAFLRISGYALEMIANHWWARYLERVTMLAP